MGTKIRNMAYFAQETAKSLWRNGMMTIASITTVTVSVFILGLFLTIFLNSRHVASYLEDTVQISVYMKNSASDDQINITGAEIAALPGVIEVKTVTKEQALERFRDRLGKNANILSALADNPLPYSFDVHVDMPERIDELIPKIQVMPNVETAKYGKDVVDQLFKFTKVLRFGGIVVILLMSLATLFIIVNTIQLTVYARKTEIEIMKYVGATDWFIRWPFLLEGIVIGLLGACISAFILTTLYSMSIGKVQAALAFMPVYNTWPLMIWIWIVLLLAGSMIGALGSYISLRKFLQV